MTEPRLHATPPSAVTERLTERVDLDGRSFTIERPGTDDYLLAHPAVRAAYAADDYLPY